MPRKKTGGRKAGTPNKDNAPVKAALTELFNNNFHKVQADLDTLEPKDRLAVIIKLAEFVIPKPQRLDVELNATVSDTVTSKLSQLAEDNEK